jgi:hypothetical protein
MVNSKIPKIKNPEGVILGVCIFATPGDRLDPPGANFFSLSERIRNKKAKKECLKIGLVDFRLICNNG